MYIHVATVSQFGIWEFLLCFECVHLADVFASELIGPVLLYIIIIMIMIMIIIID